MSHKPSEAIAFCQQMARNHYENFPVASRLLPGRLRQPIAVIYAFARTADDFADEGDLNAAQRIAALDNMRIQLLGLEHGEISDDPIFQALAWVIQEHQLPVDLFLDLLSAFTQDVSKTRYADFGEVVDYCRRSANPVGRLLLHLHKQDNPRNLAYSDGICSALQLINFLQDLNQDAIENDRIYIPRDELEKFRVTEDHLRNKVSDGAMRQLLNFQIERAEKILRAGAPLGKALTGRFGFEIRMTILGGSRILSALKRQDNCFTRPRLSTSDWLWMTWHALIKK